MTCLRTASSLVPVALVALAFPALAAAAPEKCFGRDATIVGTRGDDRLRGTRGNDVIVAGNGDDLVYGGGGDDLVCLGSDDDTADAGDGADRVSGGPGDDVVRGGDGPDVLLGSLQDDVLHGHAGNDRLDLGSARNVDYAYGGLGRDVFAIDPGEAAFAYGNKGADRLVGMGIRHLLDGGPGHDHIEGGIASFETSPRPVTVDIFEGVAVGDGVDQFVDVLGASGSAHGDTLMGSENDDWIRGMDGRDVLTGGAGEDDLFGGLGEDRLIGDEDDDTLWDGPDDCYPGTLCVSDEAVDFFDGGEGRDRLSYLSYWTGVTVDLAAGAGADGDVVTGIEDVFGSIFDDVLAGDDGDNELDAHLGDNLIDGRGGVDACYGAEVQTNCETTRP